MPEECYDGHRVQKSTAIGNFELDNSFVEKSYLALLMVIITQCLALVKIRHHSGLKNSFEKVDLEAQNLI